MLKISAILLVAVLLLSSCAYVGESTGTETSPSTTTITDETSQFEINKIISEGKYHKIVSHGGKKTTLYIFDKDGNTVFEEYNDQYSVNITELEDAVVINTGMGNGPRISRYYNIKNNVFSNEYHWVALYENGIVIYPSYNPKGIAIKSVFDDSVDEFVESDIDLSWNKTIKSASITDGVAEVEFSCFENGDYENSVVKSVRVDLGK